jgi:hypothetical protein
VYTTAAIAAERIKSEEKRSGKKHDKGRGKGVVKSRDQSIVISGDNIHPTPSILF